MLTAYSLETLGATAELLESPTPRRHGRSQPFKGHRSGNTFRKLPKSERRSSQDIYVPEGKRTHRAAVKQQHLSLNTQKSKHLERYRASKKDYRDWAVCDLVDTVGPPKRRRRKGDTVFDLQRFKAVLMRSTSSEESEALSMEPEDDFISPRISRRRAWSRDFNDCTGTEREVASALYKLTDYKSPKRLSTSKRHASLKYRTGNTLRRGAGKYGDPYGVHRKNDAVFERYSKYDPSLRRRIGGRVSQRVDTMARSGGHDSLRFAKVFTKQLSLGARMKARSQREKSLHAKRARRGMNESSRMPAMEWQDLASSGVLA